MSLISIKNIDTGYGNKQVLFNVSMEIQENETALIIGANGSGKSTLLKVLYGLIRPWNNDALILYKGENIIKLKPNDFISRGIVFSKQQDELFEELSVIENLEIAGICKYGRREIDKRIEEMIEHFPLLKLVLKRKCQYLSGGERKQLSIAMAMINEPELIILDEPLAGVSPNYTDNILIQLQELKQSGVTLLFTEHKLKDVFCIADKIVGLKLGRIFDKEITSVEETSEVMI